MADGLKNAAVEGAIEAVARKLMEAFIARLFGIAATPAPAAPITPPAAGTTTPAATPPAFDFSRVVGPNMAELNADLARRSAELDRVIAAHRGLDEED